jgi:hypothetical protein
LCIANLEGSNFQNVLSTKEGNNEDHYVKMGNDTKWKRSRNIFRKESKGYTITWDYIDGEPSFEKKTPYSNENQFLISFWNAFAKVQDAEVFMQRYTFSKELKVNDQEWKSVERMYEITNKLYFFVPTSWSIEVEMFKTDLKNILKTIKYLGLETKQFFWYDDINKIYFERFVDLLKLLIESPKSNHGKLLKEIKKNTIKSETNSKIIIYTEGNNIIYLQSALEILKIDLPIEFHNYGGKNDLQKYFKLLVKNKHSIKCIFLFDCDVESEYEDCKKHETEFVKALRIPRNSSNIKVIKGIENLFTESLFTDEFYDTKIIPKDDGGKTIVEELNKQKFLNVITESKDSAIFENFRKVFEIIEENIKE